MKIRLATEDDFDGYYQIKSDSKNIFWGGWMNAPDYENFKNVFISRINDSCRREYVCEIENQIAGYLAAVICDSSIEISYGVKSHYSGRGVATSLISHVINEFQHNNIVAWVSDKNFGSEKCLLKNGFKKTREVEKRFLQQDKAEHSFYKWERKFAS